MAKEYKKDICRVFLAGIIVLLAGAYFGGKDSKSSGTESFSYRPDQEVAAAADTLAPREAMLLGLIMVESQGRTRAVSSAGARGILQIMPVYVDEANRICRIEGRETTFTFDDAFDERKSVEMFMIVSERHCGTGDDPETIAKTIRRHNPKAGEWYSQRVFRAMETVQSNPAERQKYRRFLEYL